MLQKLFGIAAFMTFMAALSLMPPPGTILYWFLDVVRFIGGLSLAAVAIGWLLGKAINGAPQRDGPKP